MDDAALEPLASTAPPLAGAAADDAGGAASPQLSPPSADGVGRVRFASMDQRDAAIVRLERTGWVVAELEGIGPSARGRLAEAIDEAVDAALAARGAAGPGITSGSDRDAALGDQLFRARRAGAPGVALILGPLRAAAGYQGALEPEDAATLTFLGDATRERPLVLVLDARDATTGAYAEAVSLRQLLVPAPAAMLAPTPVTESASAAAAATMAATATGSATATAPATAPAPALALAAATAPTLAPTPTLAPAPSLAPAPAPTPSPRASAVLDDSSPPAHHTAGAVVVAKEEAWRAWTLQLTAARGPQPLATLERLFAESYMPLANAIARGLDDPRARHAHDEFAATFSKGYTDAFATFASTTKRPRMVFDAHDLAARIGRLHGARSTRVLLVDAMRWDVARMVEEQVVARLGSRASLTDELLLWSALPTTSLRQLECIARGVEALRLPATLDAEPEPPRGRTAEFVRRMRVGAREVHKLDVVEARLQAAHGAALRELPDAAAAAAEAIARHAETCAPRTLLLVTGDHGFTVDRGGTARQGGASPEEVLVGAFALLVGEVH